MKTCSLLGLRWRRGRAEWCRQGGGVVTSSTGERRQRTGGGGEGGGEERAEVRRWRGDGGASGGGGGSYIAPLVGQLEDLHGLMRLLLLGQLTKTLHVLQDEATWDSQLYNSETHDTYTHPTDAPSST
ncbi:hypothetical protein EJB05_14026, partial [Eragrostis curvula]